MWRTQPPTQEAPMQEYKNDKLVVRYDPAICIHAGECGARPSFCFQCVEEAVDRRERRIPGRDHRTGQALPIRRADLRTAQGRPVRPLWLSPYRRDVCRRRPRRLQASREGMLRERPKSLPAPRYILSRFLLPDIKDLQAQNLRVFFSLAGGLIQSQVVRLVSD